MAERKEVRRFVARAADGSDVTIVAERSVVDAALGPRKGPWAYHTEDGRAIIAESGFGKYQLAGTWEIFTCTDPKEPQD